MSATDNWLPSRAANSSAAKMASLVEICSLMMRARSIEVLLELDIRPRHHALAAEEQHGQAVVPRHHGAHLGNACFLEFVGDRFEHGVADIVQAHLGLDR